MKAVNTGDCRRLQWRDSLVCFNNAQRKTDKFNSIYSPNIKFKLTLKIKYIKSAFSYKFGKSSQVLKADIHIPYWFKTEGSCFTVGLAYFLAYGVQHSKCPTLRTTHMCQTSGAAGVLCGPKQADLISIRIWMGLAWEHKMVHVFQHINRDDLTIYCLQNEQQLSPRFWGSWKKGLNCLTWKWSANLLKFSRFDMLKPPKKNFRPCYWVVVNKY